jgi:hypothetical protein
MHTIHKLLAAAVIAMPVTSFAEGLSYNYVEGGYLTLEPDDTSVDFDGFRARISGLVSESIYLFGSYATVESDRVVGGNFAGAKLSSDTITAGLGWRTALGTATDLNLEAAYVYAESERKDAGALSGSEDDNGFGLSAGVRHLFSPMFEMGGSVNYVDIADDDATSYTANALLHLTPAFSLGGAYTFGDDADGWTAGVRFNF